jgi:endoribonuclease Dicer
VAFLGDAYLKYLSSIYLFVTNPTQHEGALHIARQRIISNRSLLKNADRSGLPQYIQSKPFTSRAWLPPNFRVFHPPKSVVPEEVSEAQVPASVTDPDVTMRDSEANNTLGEEPVIPQLDDTIDDNPILEDANVDASNLTITADNGDFKSNPDKSVEIQPLEATGNIISSLAPAAGKKSKRAQDDPNVQWLGDKVIDQNYSMFDS